MSLPYVRITGKTDRCISNNWCSGTQTTQFINQSVSRTFPSFFILLIQYLYTYSVLRTTVVTIRRDAGVSFIVPSLLRNFTVSHTPLSKKG